MRYRTDMALALATRTAKGQVLGKTGNGMGGKLLTMWQPQRCASRECLAEFRRYIPLYSAVGPYAINYYYYYLSPAVPRKQCSPSCLCGVHSKPHSSRPGLAGWLAATSPGQSFQHLSISTCHRDEAPATHMNHLTLSIIAPRLSSSSPAYPRNIGTWIPFHAIVL